MRKNILLKSTMRQPFISILLILLIGLVSYGFVGKAVETLIVWRETNRLEGYYRSIGYIAKDWEVEEKHTFSEAAEIIGGSPAIAYQDLVRTTSAVMRDYYNLDFETGTMDVAETDQLPASMWAGGGVFNLDYWFYGTLIHYEKQYAEENGVEFFAGYLLIFSVDEVLAGYPERIQSGRNYVMWIPARFTVEINQMAPQLDQMEVDHKYFIRAWHRPGGNYIVSNLPISVWNQRQAFNLKALDDENLWYLEVGKDEKIDLTLPEYRKLKLEIDRLNANLRTITLIGTSDMSAMPEMQPAQKWNYLLDGRWINHQDEIDGNQVIVIPEPLAKIRNIKIGDEINFTIHSLTDPYFSYIRGQLDIENWKSYPSQEITYRVVGIYSNEGFNYGKSAFSCDSYVPNSTIGDEFTQPDFLSPLKDKYLAYNFVLKNPRTQDAFIEEYKSKINELGFELEFIDNNGRNFMAGADPLRRSMSLSMTLFTIALLISVGFTIFIFLRRNEKNVAIMRALGVPVQDTEKQLLSTIIGLGLLGTSLGAFFAFRNAQAEAQESLSKLPLPSGVFPELTINPSWGIAFCLLILCFLFIGSVIGIKKISATPILVMLQENPTKTKRRTVEEDNEAIRIEETRKRDEFTDSEMRTLSRKRNPWNTTMWYSFLSILRAPAKSLLTIGIAASMLLAMGWIKELIDKNKMEIDRLYRTTSIEIDIKSPIGVNNQDFFKNQIDRNFVKEMLDSNFVHDFYLSSALLPKSITNSQSGEPEAIIPYDFLAVTDVEIGTHHRFNIVGGINWLSGYGPDDISALWSYEDVGTKAVPLVISELHKEQEGWQLGDVLTIELSELTEPVNFMVIGEVASFGVGGIKYLPGGKGVNVEPLLTNLSAIEKHNSDGLPMYLEMILYTEPTMNHRLDDFKYDLSKRNLSPLIIRFWDEELNAVVEPMEKNLSLMERLFPVSLLLCGVIPGVLCLLLVLNRAKEIAILRMLGVSKVNIRNVQIIQNLVPGLIGLALGTISLILLRSVDVFQLPVGMAALIYLTGCFLGSLAGASVVSNKKPMELLQVKE